MKPKINQIDCLPEWPILTKPIEVIYTLKENNPRTLLAEAKDIGLAVIGLEGEGPEQVKDRLVAAIYKEIKRFSILSEKDRELLVGYDWNLYKKILRYIPK
jgi:hypothetical protein